MFRMIARYQPFSPTVTRKPDAAGRSVWKLETRPAAISIGDSPKVATSAGLKVCYRKLPGKHMLFLSFTGFDRKATLRGRARSELAAVLGAVTADALTLEGPIGS